MRNILELQRPRLAFDIETDVHAEPIDETPAGLDPRCSSIISIGMIFDFGDRNYVKHWFKNDGSVNGEGKMIVECFDTINQLSQKVDSSWVPMLMTWNGTFFDLPFLMHRLNNLSDDMQTVIALGKEWSTPFFVKMLPALEFQPKYGYLSGTPEHGLTGMLGSFNHYDLAYAINWQQKVVDEEIASWSLKPVAQHYGLNPVAYDFWADHTDEELKEYNLFDCEMVLKIHEKLCL